MSDELPVGLPADLSVELTAPPSEALAAVARTAKEWGADWQPHEGGGRLTLPLSAGLRVGLLDGRLEARAGGRGTRLVIRVERAVYRLRRGPLGILLLGALGSLPVILWPFRPQLLALAPAGLVLAFLAWFLVAARLRTAGAEEFLEAVRDRLAD